MMTLLLFGLNLSPLYRAISQVESERGATSDNVYQIRPIYVRDVNRIYGYRGQAEYNARDVYDRDKAEYMMYLYWSHYAPVVAKRCGTVIDYELLARLHNGGPTLAMTSATDCYWARVKKELKAIRAAAKEAAK